MGSKNIKIIVLLTFVMVLGLRGACYSVFLSAEPDHSCCSSAAIEHDITDSACCDEIAPGRQQIEKQCAPSIVVEIISFEELVADTQSPDVWLEVNRPPPRRLFLTRPLAPRAPPLS